ncbi:MAG: DUF4373 domain-containing protein [Prevotella sp.]|jgi:hypothetical protein|nr:DUF4373 domain-containing protein [Prevotella sp.]
MARPLKTGIDYFPFDVNFFSDIKIRRIFMACGANSTSVIICLLCNIYQDKGYYIKWNKDLSFLIADTVGVSEGTASEIITKAIQVGLFDEEVFNQYKVLTSEGIQQRYLTAIERRKQIDWKKEYLLGALKEQINASNNPVNASNNPVNVNNNPVNDNRSTQSKVKEIKEKNISPLPEEIVRGGDFLNSIIPPDDGVERNWDRFKEILRGYQCSEKDFRTLCVISNYGEIGHPVWGQIAEVRNSNGKINQPVRFILSRLFKK